MLYNVRSYIYRNLLNLHQQKFQNCVCAVCYMYSMSGVLYNVSCIIIIYKSCVSFFDIFISCSGYMYMSGVLFVSCLCIYIITIIYKSHVFPFTCTSCLDPVLMCLVCVHVHDLLCCTVGALIMRHSKIILVLENVKIEIH